MAAIVGDIVVERGHNSLEYVHIVRCIGAIFAMVIVVVEIHLVTKFSKNQMNSVVVLFYFDNRGDGLLLLQD